MTHLFTADQLRGAEDRSSLAAWLTKSPFTAYTYSYPHKSAYRPFQEPLSLRPLWEQENRSSLFLYLHLPFCEYRCGFCNLFTLAQPEGDLVSAYLKQLEVQCRQLREAIGEMQFARLAIGGGTPTFLSVTELEQVFHLLSNVLGWQCHTTPVSVEASPATLTPEKIQLLHEWGVTRLSLGVQSFDEQALGQLGRPQRRAVLDQTLEWLTDSRFPRLNLDLIYGAEEQTLSSWLDSLELAIQAEPEEIYLYPLYVRPLTGLGKRGVHRTPQQWDDFRLEAYREARQRLMAANYHQVSLRMFQRNSVKEESGPIYCCQSDGMIGVGCGARSYTQHAHYCTEFAVGKRGVKQILLDYLRQSPEWFTSAHYGFSMTAEEHRRRYLLLSLLQCSGISLHDSCKEFGAALGEHFPQLHELEEHGLAIRTEDRFQLTPAGVERSDLIGPWLYSERVRSLMEEFECQ